MDVRIRAERKSAAFSLLHFTFCLIFIRFLVAALNTMQTASKLPHFFFALFFSIFSPLSERSEPRSPLSDFSALLPSLRVPSSVDEVVGCDCPHLAISSCSLILVVILEIQAFRSSCLKSKNDIK